MAHLSIRFLGSLRVAVDGAPVTSFESDKVRALLAYLAVESERPHRREHLAGLLWPQRPERNARQNLSRALFDLRQTIGDRAATPSFLLATHQTLQFNPSSNHRLDVHAFSGLLAACEAHPHDALAACEPCLNRLQQAVELYAGEFLAGFSLPGSPAFEEWVLLERERLQLLVADALHWLAESGIGRGEYDAARQHARRLLELDPLQETAHRQVMRALACNGGRSAALAQYERCRQILAEELGVEPAPQTTALYRRILAGENVATPPHNLPSQSTPFVGRQTLLDAIAGQLADPACRLLTLVGPGGCGKTRLALEAAAAQLERYPHGVYFVALAPLDDVQAIVPTVADALGFSFYSKETEAGPVPPRQQLLDYLRGKTLLLIMDNYEHLLDGVGLVTEILSVAPRVKVLVTSRARLNVGGEHRFPIAGMDYPDAQTLVGGPDDIAQYSAIQLFLQSARRAQPGFELAGDNLREVARVCTLVQGMPLAIRLAAAWVAAVTPVRIVAEITRSLDFLETERRDAPARQHSMRATFDHSWRLLTGREREVLGAASVFRGGFTPEATQAVTGASLRELRALVDKSLLQHTPSGRYELHELLRQYAQEKLDASPVVARAARDRHCTYYAAALERWGKELKGPRQGAALAEMRADGQNARAAWEWAVADRHVARLDQALEGLCHFYEARGRFQEGAAACRAAAEALQATAEPLSTGERDGQRVCGRLLVWQGTFCHALTRLEDAGQLLQQGLDLLEASARAGVDTRADRAWALHVLASVARDTGDADVARKVCAQSLALYRSAGDLWGTATSLGGSASLAMFSGDYDKARRYAEESLALGRQLGSPRSVGHALLSLGRIAEARGEFEKAETLLREAVTVLEEAGHGGGGASGALFWLIMTLIKSGRFVAARPVAEKALARSEDTGARAHAIWARLALGAIQAHQGRYREARVQWQTGLDLSRELGLRVAVGRFLELLGAVALRMEAYPEAQRLMQEGASLVQAFGSPPTRNSLLIHLAYLAHRLGEPSRARRYLYPALQWVVETRDLELLMVALPAVALLRAGAGDVERAVELYALAARYPFVANSCWFQDVAEKPIAARAATLPPEIVAAAQERGRARDLWDTAAELVEELAPSASLSGFVRAISSHGLSLPASQDGTISKPPHRRLDPGRNEE